MSRGDFMKYSIGDFSKITNLSIHTLRYYEKENLIRPERNSANRRCYTEKDLKWVEFIKRLKDTGMPIKEIKYYSELRSKGDSTFAERMEILIQHKQFLNEQISKLQEHQLKLNDKIDFYGKKIKISNTNRPVR